MMLKELLPRGSNDDVHSNGVFLEFHGINLLRPFQRIMNSAALEATTCHRGWSDLNKVEAVAGVDELDEFDKDCL